MNISDLQKAINSGKYDKDLSVLYSSINKARERYINAISSFASYFNNKDEIFMF